MESSGTNYDVIVLGGGLSGMSAAFEAASEGASVVVLEVASTIGGSAALSGGYVWSMRSVDDLMREDPGAYQKHGHIVVEGYHDTIAWLSGFTEPLSEEQDALSGRGRRFDIPLTISFLARGLISRGGRVELGAEVSNIRTVEDGYLVSFGRQGTDTSVKARSVIFASGGRQADPAVRADLVGGRFTPELRGNPNSRGRGAALAAQLGASINVDNKGFYGHLYPAGVQALSPADFITLALYHSSSGAIIDPSGARFTDESRGDHVNAMALAQRGGRGVLLWSEAVQREAVGAGFVPGLSRIDRFAFCQDRGARASVVEQADDIAPLLDGWGYGFDRSVGMDDVLGAGSVYVVEVVPAVTFTFGGIEVDESGQVVDAERRRIPGVFAAGADMSDAYHQGYGGGLSLAVVSGRRAGRLAAHHSSTQHGRAGHRETTDAR